MLATGSGEVEKLTVKWDGCIHKDSLLNTNKGIIPISEVIKRHTNGEEFLIYGHRFESESDEYIPLLNSVSKSGNKKWIELVLDNDEIIKLTEDHEVYTSNRGWVAAKDLTLTDDIKDIPNK